MSRENGGFVPIDEANSDKVRFAIDLPPYVDRYQIRANTPRIERLMRIGGINHLRVETFEGDRVSETPTILGFDTQGNAYAGKTGTSAKQKEFDVNSSANNRKRGGSPTADVTIKLDITKINESVIQNNVRSSNAWAQRIDKGIGTGLRNAGSRVLLVENAKQFIQVYYLGNQAFWLANNLSQQDFEGVIFDITVLPILSQTILRYFYGQDRFSLIFGPQLDRAALLQVRSRLQRVVKSTEEMK